MGWIEGEKAIGGGGERDNVVPKCRATQLSEFVVVIEQIGRNATHTVKIETLAGFRAEFEIWGSKRE